MSRRNPKGRAMRVNLMSPKSLTVRTNFVAVHGPKPSFVGVRNIQGSIIIIIIINGAPK